MSGEPSTPPSAEATPAPEPQQAPVGETPVAEASAEAPEAGATGDGTTAPAGAGPATSISVEDLVADLERVSKERDDYLDALRRMQAEFENYRKAVVKRESDARERANEGLVVEMLPVLDACDGAVSHGSEDVAPIRTSLLDALAKQGLERMEPAEDPFDPERHEAVMHEPADDAAGPVVAEVLRVGYAWRGRTLRPAMVKVRG